MPPLVYNGYQITVLHNRFYWRYGSALHIGNIKKQIDAYRSSHGITGKAAA